ncbi:MAG: 16S rRNA (adenine(1518)-N(6)/adenine(1519)-N(6))-dimethyltransferase RsmA [Actinomycetota bacterium]
MSDARGPTHEQLRERAARYGIRPTKALGQNFLLDPNLARAIAADARVAPGSRVVEVGAGMGSLTIALADAGAAEVLAIEFDRTLLPALRDAAANHPSIRVLHADATKIDWDATLGTGSSWVLCSNLPYNVGTRILLDVLEHASDVERAVVMVQREVGERLVARPGDEAYGALSLKVAYRASTSIVRRVPPDVFWPRPAVGSVVVRLERVAVAPVDVDEARLWRVVEGSFAQRRKTMRNAMRRLGLPPDEADRLLEQAGVDPAARPEELSLAAFASVAERWSP